MDYSSFTRLKVSTASPGVLHCELDRPKKLNSFDNTFWYEIRDCFSLIDRDDTVRAVLLSGSGRAFTAGLDIFGTNPYLGDSGDGEEEEEEEDPARKGLRIRNTGKEWQASFTNIAECSKPVVACVHGACIGAGIEMISACDVRLCSSDAFFEMAEVDVALAADVGGLQRFPKIVGNDSLVRELALTARRFNSEEALSMGFVSRVLQTRAECMAAGLAVCESVAAKSPLAVLGVKRLLNYSRDHSVRDSLDYALTWNQSAIQSKDMGIAAGAKMTKSVGQFRPLPPRPKL